MQRVLRVENHEGRGPFTRPYPYTVGEFQKYIPWVRIRPGFHSLEPELSDDEAHPHHFTDVLERHFERSQVLQNQLWGENVLGPGDWRTATKDEQQLRHWFAPEALGFLASHGFNVAVYDVPETAVWSGNFQVVFDRERAVLRGYDNRPPVGLSGANRPEPATRCVCYDPDKLLFRCASCPERASAIQG